MGDGLWSPRTSSSGRDATTESVVGRVRRELAMGDGRKSAFATKKRRLENAKALLGFKLREIRALLRQFEEEEEGWEREIPIPMSVRLTARVVTGMGRRGPRGLGTRVRMVHLRGSGTQQWLALGRRPAPPRWLKRPPCARLAKSRNTP